MEVSKEVKTAILSQEIQMYLNTQWQTELRYRVSKKLGNSTEELTEELVKIEKVLDILNEELKSINNETV